MVARKDDVQVPWRGVDTVRLVLLCSGAQLVSVRQRSSSSYINSERLNSDFMYDLGGFFFADSVSLRLCGNQKATRFRKKKKRNPFDLKFIPRLVRVRTPITVSFFDDLVSLWSSINCPFLTFPAAPINYFASVAPPCSYPSHCFLIRPIPSNPMTSHFSFLLLLLCSLLCCLLL